MQLSTITGAGPQELAAATALILAAESHDGTSPISDQAMLAARQGSRTLLSFFTEDPKSQPVAVGVIGDGEVDLVVAPGHRNQGIGSAALTALLALPEVGTGPLRAWVHGDVPAAETMLAARGFHPTRSLLRLDLSPALLPERAGDPLALPVPSGFRLRQFRPDEPADHTAWVAANAAAFATHPEQGKMTEADLALLCAEPWFDAADLIVLEVTAPPTSELGADPAVTFAGSTWIKTVAAETAGTGVHTELYAIGVRPEYAGRGLGNLLMQATLARMAEHHPSEISLYVDGENTRAVELYERAGFTSGSLSRQWTLVPSATADARIDA